MLERESDRESESKTNWNVSLKRILSIKAIWTLFHFDPIKETFRGPRCVCN